MSAFPWSRLKHGGFSQATPRLPVQPDAESNNVEVSSCAQKLVHMYISKEMVYFY